MHDFYPTAQSMKMLSKSVEYRMFHKTVTITRNKLIES